MFVIRKDAVNISPFVLKYTQSTPYQLFYGRPPRIVPEIRQIQDQGILKENQIRLDLNKKILQQICEHRNLQSNLLIPQDEQYSFEIGQRVLVWAEFVNLTKKLNCLQFKYKPYWQRGRVLQRTGDKYLILMKSGIKRAVHRRICRPDRTTDV